MRSLPPLADNPYEMLQALPRRGSAAIYAYPTIPSTFAPLSRCQTIPRVEGTIPTAVRTIPHLTLVPGALADFARVGGVSVELAAADDPILRHVVRVVEEDTHLVLSAPAWIPDRPFDPSIRILEDVARFEPHRPGTVVDAGGRLLAVVHDLCADPTTNPAWIDRAVAAALEVAAKRRLERLVFEPLGTVHARLPTRVVVTAIVEALKDGHPSLASVVLLVPRAQRDAAERALGDATPHAPLADRGQNG